MCTLVMRMKSNHLHIHTSAYQVAYSVSSSSPPLFLMVYCKSYSSLPLFDLDMIFLLFSFLFRPAFHIFLRESDSNGFSFLQTALLLLLTLYLSLAQMSHSGLERFACISCLSISSVGTCTEIISERCQSPTFVWLMTIKSWQGSMRELSQGNRNATYMSVVVVAQRSYPMCSIDRLLNL